MATAITWQLAVYAYCAAEQEPPLARGDCLSAVAWLKLHKNLPKDLGKGADGGGCKKTGQMYTVHMGVHLQAMLE